MYCTACGELIKNRSYKNKKNQTTHKVQEFSIDNIFASDSLTDFIALPIYGSILIVNKKTKDLVYFHHAQLAEQAKLVPSKKKLKVLPDDEDSILIDHTICGGFLFLRTEKHLYYLPIIYLHSDMVDQYAIGNELPGYQLSHEKSRLLSINQKIESDKNSFGTIFGYQDQIVIISDRQKTIVGTYNIELNNERPWQIQRLKNTNSIEYDENYNIFIERKQESYRRLYDNYGDFMFFCTTNTSLEIYQHKASEEKLNKKSIDTYNRTPLHGSLVIGSLPRLIIQNKSKDNMLRYSVISEKGVRIQDIHSPKVQVEKIYNLANGSIMALANGLFYDVDEGVGNVSGQPRNHTQKTILYSDEMIILYVDSNLTRLFFKQLEKEVILGETDVTDDEIEDDLLVCASRDKAYIFSKRKANLIISGFEE